MRVRERGGGRWRGGLTEAELCPCLFWKHRSALQELTPKLPPVSGLWWRQNPLPLPSPPSTPKDVQLQVDSVKVRVRTYGHIASLPLREKVCFQREMVWWGGLLVVIV